MFERVIHSWNPTLMTFMLLSFFQCSKGRRWKQCKCRRQCTRVEGGTMTLGVLSVNPTRDPLTTLYLALLYRARSGSRPQPLTLSVTHFHFIICPFYPLVRIIPCQPKPTRRHSLAIQSPGIIRHWKKLNGKKACDTKCYHLEIAHQDYLLVLAFWICFLQMISSKL